MDGIATLFLTGLGLFCIFLGYRLFCGLPAMNGLRASRSSVILLNVVPGALLALFGAGLLTAEVRGVISHRPPISYHQPAAGTAWHRVQSRLRARQA